MLSGPSSPRNISSHQSPTRPGRTKKVKQQAFGDGKNTDLVDIDKNIVAMGARVASQ